MGPRKSANYAGDVRHWAELCGAPVSPDARRLLKSDTSLALRAAMVTLEDGGSLEFHHSAYRARWAEARDLSDRNELRALLVAANLDADAILEKAESSELEKRLDEETTAAIERGVFGVPTMFVGEEMFWGNDRFELVRHYIEKSRGSAA